MTKVTNKALIQEILIANADKSYTEIFAIANSSAIPNPPKVNSGETTRDDFIKSTIAWGVRLIKAVNPEFAIAMPLKTTTIKTKDAKSVAVKVKSAGPIKAPNGSLAAKPKNAGLSVEEIADRNAKRIATLKDVGQRYGAKTEKLESKIIEESAVVAA